MTDRCFRAFAVALTMLATVGATRPAAGQVTFRHPGVLVNQAQLDFIAGQANAGIEPWTSALAKAAASTYGSPTYTPKPWQSVECGPSSNPNFGCSDERNDALAAYTQALLWYVTRDDTYAQNAIMIMNAWSSTLTGGHTNSNARLQAGWTGSVWPEAAEIIRSAYPGWSVDDIAAFQSMLATQHVPYLLNGAPCSNGNWELIITEALMNISVFSENAGWFDKAVSLWRGRVPAYMYLSSDGPSPVPPPHCSTSVTTYWHQTQFVDGLAQETARDFGHTFWGLAAAVNTAETALQQGVDLYSENADRIVAAFEFHDGINNGGARPAGINVGPIGGNSSTMEIVYNHVVNRLGGSMPETAAQIALKRPTGASYFLAWETLTHAQVGGIGLTSDPIDGAVEIFPSYNVQNRTGRSLDEVYETYIDRGGQHAHDLDQRLRWRGAHGAALADLGKPAGHEHRGLRHDVRLGHAARRGVPNQEQHQRRGGLSPGHGARHDSQRQRADHAGGGHRGGVASLDDPLQCVDRPGRDLDGLCAGAHRQSQNGLARLVLQERNLQQRTARRSCSTAYFKNFRHFYRGQ